ncbi:hypothetical protein XI04_03530 [Bradyrhizobium sp. CCBAU 11430]|uniref:hypothetical protein n=1 Tax=Bradyrhizobium sp. CCBAU 11430 TaxID=1630881 RepID=UPI002306427D|nr:hypothetical protein [Bradyrhizobium sp. CCBAU 11430]MDA9512142.1 hypothetical protein [Bradyrhizobium sp. CCBAU 11430]
MYQITDRAKEIDLAAGGTRDDYEPFADPRAATKQAIDFFQLASAKVTPADLYVERWLAAST